MTRSNCSWMLTSLLLLAAVGCGGGTPTANPTPTSASNAPADMPSFSLAWSEYPSWSVFGVAHRRKLIDGAKGKLGPIEEKWKVDIELQQKDYDPCLVAYATAACDAVCITNIDILSPAGSRPGVAILPTSTSDGADACIVTGIDDVDQLKGHKVYGLAKSVSEYCFARCLQELGKAEADFEFANNDPAAASLAMQQGQAGYEAIMVWNPYVLQTLRTRQDTKVLFDSSKIPGEIIDMVVIAEDSLKKPGADAFCHAVIDCYYEMNKVIEAPATRNEALVQIGEDFSDLKLEDMTLVVQQTKFYKNAEEGANVLAGADLPKTMEKVLSFCESHEMFDGKRTVGYGKADAAAPVSVRFDDSYIKAVQAAGGTE
jgi:NitT/TauT family transport system substrate-binding protein